MYSYGNYYTWAAAIADTAYHNTNNQPITSASICPSGWHIPTGGSAYASGSTSGINVTGDVSTFLEFYNLGYELMDKVMTAYEDTPNNGWSSYRSATNTIGDTGARAFRRFPNNFLYSGKVEDSGIVNRGSNGYYWTSTSSNIYDSYYLSLSSSSANTGAGVESNHCGRTLRCVAGNS